MVRRALAEPMAIRAGGMAQVSLAILRAWMRTASVERRSSRPPGLSCELDEDIAETCGSHEKTKRDSGCEENPNRHVFDGRR